MGVVAHGIDLVEVARIGAMVDRHGERFLSRVFTEGERAYSEGKARRDEHLAARFAAKEAVLKALGCGWSRGVAWTDVEVTRKPTGEPGVALHGKAAEIAVERGIGSWLISLSHGAGVAHASAVALGGRARS